MNFFRRLDATFSGELLAAQAATTSRATEATADPDAWVPAPEHPEIWAVFATLADNPGVLSPDTPGLPLPADPAVDAYREPANTAL